MSARITLNVSKAAVTTPTLPPMSSGNVVMTVAGLRASTNTPITSTVTTTDFGGGLWYYAGPYDGEIEDNTGTVIVTANGKVWKRIFTGPMYVDWFGPVGNGIADDIIPLQSAVDYAEANSIKILDWGVGEYYVSTPVIQRKGGTVFIGRGALAKEESWTVLFPNNPYFANNKPFSGGTSIIANKNQAAIQIAPSAVDNIGIFGIQFKVKGEARTVGTTTAIDFRGEWTGPVWPFVVEGCHFRGFNYAIKFESPTQYCVASVRVVGNAFSQNDECLYFADVPPSSVTNIGQRNLTWGLTFHDNKAHDNSRLVRGMFSKSMVSIVHNNSEGNIARADGTYPEAIYDIEISNCSVDLIDNHFETITSAKCIKVSSNFVMADGTVQGYANTTQNSPRHRVFINGNNFDGVYNPNIVRIEVTGCVVWNNDPSPIHGDGIFIENKHVNNQALLMADRAKQIGSTFKFPITGTENRIANAGSQVAWARTAKFDGGTNMFLRETPLGVRQVVAAKASRLASIAAGYGGNVDNSIKYLGATILVNSSHQSDFLGNLFFSRHYRNAAGDMVHDSVNPYSYIYGVPNGWSFISTYIPNPFPIDSTERSGFFGLATGGLQDKEVLVACDYTAYGFTIDDPEVVPYFSDRIEITKAGTFYPGQSFKDGTDVNFVIDGGTIGTLTGVTASSTDIFDDFITVNDSSNIIPGHRIQIGARSFWVMKVEGNIVRLDDMIGSVLAGAAVQYRAPVFTLDDVLKAGFLKSTNEVYSGYGYNVKDQWLFYQSGPSGWIRDLVGNRMHMEFFPAGGDVESSTNMYSSLKVIGHAGFNGNEPVGKAADPGTAAGTDPTADAAVINAIVTVLRNVGLVS